jgi:hypothetical protein
LSVTPAPVSEIAEDLSASSKIVQALKDNQLLTAVSLFVLWELDLFNSVIVYGCGI